MSINDKLIENITPYHFTRKEIFKWVEAYPTISQIENIYEAEPDEIVRGFDRILKNKNLYPSLYEQVNGVFPDEDKFEEKETK